MATKKAAVAKKYVDLISKTEAEKQTDKIGLDVELAQNALKQGQLSIKAKMIDKESKVSEAKARIAQAERDLESAKSLRPFNVQRLLDARTAVKQAELDVKTAEGEYSQYREAFEFLEATEAELF